MGKYMKKSKLTSDVAIMDVVSLSSPQCTLGVRTRAKTLALQRQQESQKTEALFDDSSFSYLELRSRRLEKPAFLGEAKRRSSPGHGRTEELRGGIGNPSPKMSWSDSRFRVRSVESLGSLGLDGDEDEDQHDVALEASFGENNLDFEARDRSTRESTPCSLIREPENLTAPGSTTRRTSSSGKNQRVRNDMRRNIPTGHEMEEFFTIAEQQQQRIFIEKYNFDVASDSPLPGRYEWVQV